MHAERDLSDAHDPCEALTMCIKQEGNKKAVEEIVPTNYVL